MLPTSSQARMSSLKQASSCCSCASVGGEDARSRSVRLWSRQRRNEYVPAWSALKQDATVTTSPAVYVAWLLPQLTPEPIAL